MIKGKNKITVIVNGRFHAFDYAYELHKAGRLHRLISTMPYSSAKKFNIPRKLYVGFPIFEAFKILYRYLFNKELPTLLYAKLFTKLANCFIQKNTDVIISFAGYSHEVFDDERHKDKIKILDRGSTHTISNISLNKQAAIYHGKKFISHSPSFVNREINEYNLADLIMIPSTFVKQTFIENNVDENKLIFNPYAFSTTMFPVRSEIVNRDSQTILFVGQLSSRKGIKVLIDAFKLLKKELPNLKLWLVGSSSMIDLKSIELDGIEYFGKLNKEALKVKYEKASLLCLPSYEEGFGLVLVEAKYFRLPIITTLNTGVVDLFSKDENGYKIFEVGNPIDLKNKLKFELLKINKTEINENVNEISWNCFTKNLLNHIEMHEKNL